MNEDNASRTSAARSLHGVSSADCRSAGCATPAGWQQDARKPAGEILPRQTGLDGRPCHAPLWLCVHLPRIALEVLGLADEDGVAAVVEEVQGSAVLHAVSQKAARAGLAPGMPLAAAYALSPGLRIESRDPALEQRARVRLAERGLAFTPWVSLDFPQALQLEVGGSLALFGGLEPLMAKLRSNWSDSGHHLRCASAPSPFAGWLLARSGHEQHVGSREALRSVLGELPVDLLDLDAYTLERLRKAGGESLRDLWRLPRDGLTRRYGTRLLALLDRAAGQRDLPPRHFHLPPCFREAMVLPEETERLEHFFPAVEVLICRLVQFLTEFSAAAGECVLQLVHRSAPATCLRQGSRRPTRDGGHLTCLLRERLERLRLPAPVSAVELSGTAIVPAVSAAADLFDETLRDPTDWPQLLDQIQARLGSAALRYVSSRPDHRPEQARTWTAQPKESTIAPEPRPLWLLPEPRALSCGDLDSVSAESERIESGWWDDAGIRRDYRRAVDRRGAGLWIYRDLQAPGQWYLHGLFG